MTSAKEELVQVAAVFEEHQGVVFSRVLSKLAGTVLGTS